jgi:hypothetical protein
MNQYTFYPRAIMQEPMHWDALEVHPVFEEEDGNCSVCEPDEATFFSVYVHDVNGGVLCIADLPTLDEAEELRELIEVLLLTHKNRR